MQIGDDLTRDRLTHVLMAVSGVKRLRIIQPATDVTIPHDGLATLTSVSVATEWAEEA
jgi:phage-related baseplate assembly protein